MGNIVKSLDRFWKGAVLPIKNTLTSHTGDGTIHITAAERTSWNAKTSNTGTITEIKMNGASKGTSGSVDLGTVLTAHQDISGKSDTGHSHAADDVTSGTFAVARLPTVTVAKGGTGQTTAPLGLYALINGSSALTNSTIATGDFFALGDVSATTGKKITLANLMSYINANLDTVTEAVATSIVDGTYGS